MYRMEPKREAWRQLWLPVAVVATFFGLLVDFAGAMSVLKAMWPVIEALLPVIALGGAAGGSVWLAGTIWGLRERLPARQKKAKEVATFSAMTQDLYRLSRLASNPHHRQEIRALAYHLNEIGISTPDRDEIGSEEGPWEMFLEEVGHRAARGQLERARRLYPVQEGDG